MIPPASVGVNNGWIQGMMRSSREVVLLCFFLSGMTGLIYELIWTRWLVLIFGSTTFAISTVLTTFMGGLALGSFLSGRATARLRRATKPLGSNNEVFLKIPVRRKP